MASWCLRVPSVCSFPTTNPAPSASGSRPEAEAELARTQSLLHLPSAGGFVTPSLLPRKVCRKWGVGGVLKLPFPDSSFKPRVEGLLRKLNVLRSLSNALEDAYWAMFPMRRTREAVVLAPGHRAPVEQEEDLSHSAAKGGSEEACLPHSR